jgi:restriction system protein
MEYEYSALMAPWHQHNEDELAPQSSFVDFTTLPLTRSAAPQSVIAAAHRQMMAELSAELLGYIYAQSHKFFEQLIIDVLLAMGYGGRRRDLARRIGRSGDGGIDGIIEMDELGLDAIYVQAKRLKPSSMVSVSAVRDFVGGLEARHATKGIFVTTGNFTPATNGLVKDIAKKVVLISGQRLTELMVRHNIGIRLTETLQFKKVDVSYFAGSGIGINTMPAATQPSK